jgi:uncharacterized membrane protein
MSVTTIIFWTAFLSFIPISELRGGIPFAIANGLPWYWAFCLGVFCNALVAPFCWIFLSTFHKLFLKMKWYEKFFNAFIERARNKLHSGIEKWGWFGVAIFVAIPFPLTGAWTGTLGAWVLGLSKKKTLLAVIIGVIISGSIVTAVVTLGAQAFNMFIKQV